MDINHIRTEKVLAKIIYDRDTLIEQLGVQAAYLTKENEALKKELGTLKAKEAKKNAKKD